MGLDARLGLSFGELREVGTEAARLGFESVWTPAGGVPDAFHISAQWSLATQAVVPGGLRTGISVVPAPRMWTVPALAAQAATLGLISGGRFVLGVGSGGYGPAFWETVGMPNRPIGVIRDYVTMLRAVLAGDTVTHDGPGVRLRNYRLGSGPVDVPVYLGTLGPDMLRLAGECADGALLNWATPEQIAWSKARVAEGAERTGRDPSAIRISMYVRVCIDDDVDAARSAFGAQTLSYAMGRPGVDTTLAYRGHFGRMGFEEVLTALEARREAGTSIAALVDETPDELLRAVGYYGPAAGAAEAYRRLSAGLDETIVRVVTARPGVEPVVEAMRALTPAILGDMR